MDINKGLHLIKECIDLLGKVLRTFEDKIGRPEFITESGRERFRYPKPTAQIFLVVKCVRVVSTYNACHCLLSKGYIQEAHALLRMIYEFINDIDFISEAHLSGNLSKAQQQMIDLFFNEDLPNPEELHNRHTKKPTISRKKIYATIARILTPHNPDRTQRIVRSIEEIFSGYVHAAYPHTMEMYVGGPWRFSTNGMAGTPRQSESLRTVISSLSQTLNEFAKVAVQFKDVELFKELIQQRKNLEASEFYGKKC